MNNVSVRYIVHDVDAAIEFCARHLGFEVLMHPAPEVEDLAAMVERLKEHAARFRNEISRHLSEAENKIWHAHPVWFLDGNPIVGYSKLKDCVRLLFWSGQSFDEPGLQVTGTFKAAEARYTDAARVDKAALQRWLAKARDIQWDYKNIVRRKGRLERLK